MTPRTYESLETKLRRLAEWAEEAGLKANIARVRICAAQQPEILELNRAIEVIGLAEMEAESMGAELAEARRREGQEPSQVVRSGAWVGACPWCGEKSDTRTVSSGEMHEQEQCMRCGARSPARRIGRREAPTYKFSDANRRSL